MRLNNLNAPVLNVLICGTKEKCGLMENMKLENAVSSVICAVRIVVDIKCILQLLGCLRVC